jgi:NitT/TauT family transport system permease protein
VLFGVFALAWQLVALHNPFAFPRIGAIWAQLTGDPREFVDAASVTLEEAGVGLGASFVVAFSLAVVMSHVAVVERAVMPLAVVLSVTPAVSLAPGLAIALGVGMAPRYIVTAVIVFFPLLVNSLVGLRSVDRDAMAYFETLNASRREILVHLRLPSSLPFLFAAARICFPLSIIGAVVAEYSATGSSNGLGSLIEVSTQQVDLPTTYGAIFCLSVLGLLFTLAVTLVERRLMSWHPTRAPGR